MASENGQPDIHAFKNAYGPEELEKKFVHDVYQEISDHFSSTRYKVWPTDRQTS
jgi:tRNA (uracil-5-)-methyltransferase TRM9